MYLCIIIAGLIIVGVAYGFTSDEIEIFQLQKEIVDKYGKEMDFYKFLKLPGMKKSTSKEIIKNLRQLSKKYHPDKNIKYKRLYERLNLATKILSNDSKRKIYDYHLKHGFPSYDIHKGGFVFSRSKPNIWVILSFLYLACGVIHLVILKLQNGANKRRINGFIRSAKEQDDTNGLGEKRLIFNQSPDEGNGKEIIIKFGDVFVIQPDGSEVQITTENIVDPTFLDSLLFKLPLWLWNKIIDRFTNRIKGKVDGKSD